jgi:hypothetical protein
MDKSNKNIKAIFAARVFLWITALVSTVYWIYYSVKLHNAGIFDPAEFATRFRPVFYTCLVISILAVILSFILHAISKKQAN